MKKALCALLAAGLLAGCAPQSQSQPQSNAAPPAAKAETLAQAAYPSLPPYPDESQFFNEKGEWDGEAFDALYTPWWEARRALRNQPEGYDDGLEGFLAAALPQFLDGASTENQVFAPVNLYLALGMLAETAGGESRDQILSLLGVDTVEDLRTKAKGLWEANYLDDGAVTSVMAASLWLNENLDFLPETVDTLAKDYYASVFRGEMGSEAFNQALQNWLNENTGSLLEEAAGGVETAPETVLALAATIYFKARWQNEFSPDATTDGTFHGPDGDTAVPFMRSDGMGAYYWGEKFGAVTRSFAEAGSMVFLLPDEGYTPADLLADPETAEFLTHLWQWENQASPVIHLSLPKFDVSAQADLVPGLKALGVTHVFDPQTADFSSITQTEPVFLSQATHAARVKIDEEGVEAAAFTVMMAAGAMPPQEEITFTLDRPFLFAILGEDGAPLFVGVVNQP